MESHRTKRIVLLGLLANEYIAEQEIYNYLLQLMDYESLQRIIESTPVLPIPRPTLKLSGNMVSTAEMESELPPPNVEDLLDEKPVKPLGQYDPTKVPEKLRLLAEQSVPGQCPDCQMAGGKDDEGNCNLCGYPAAKH
jgi:hypothetical protein